MKVNKYSCSECSNQLVVGHIDEGVTPFVLICPKCNGDMHSSFYSPDSQTLKPEFYWFKPNPTQLAKQVQWELEFFGAAEQTSTATSTATALTTPATST